MCKKYGFHVLHDRKIPNSSANIDHILITNRGVFVIDANNYEGLVHIEQTGGLLTPLEETLYVGNRRQTNLIERVKKQVAIISRVRQKDHSRTPIFWALAPYKADWPLFSKAKETDGVLINSRGIEAAVLEKPLVEGIDQSAIFTHLKVAFPAKQFLYAPSCQNQQNAYR